MRAPTSVLETSRLTTNVMRYMYYRRFLNSPEPTNKDDSPSTVMDPECANPVLLSFLKGWWDDAKASNSKGASTYKRAYESMKACPVPFEHPNEAIELSGLGPKLCERLTKAMERYCLNNGLPMPKIPKRRSQKRNATDNDHNNDDDGTQPLPPNPKRPRKTKEYVPTYRSGAYALLVALHEAGEDMLTKEQLIEMAQPHTDSSFTVPVDPTKHYTAWASMKTLMEKNLVYSRGHPKRYCLTDAGDDIAAATVAGGGPGSDSVRVESIESNSRASGQSARITVANKSLNTNQAPPRLGGAPPRLGGVLPIPDPEDEEDFRQITQRVQTSRVQSRGSSKSTTNLAAQRNRLQTLYSGRPPEYGKDRPALRVDRSILQGKPIDIEDLTSSPPMPQPQILRTLSKSSSNARSTIHDTDKSVPPLLIERPSVSTFLPNTHTTSVVPSQSSQPAYSTRSHPASVQPSPPIRLQSIQHNPPVFPSFVPEVLQPGTFSIHLLLDNREVRAKHDRDYIANTLSSSGVTPTTRSLAVGDVLWIAREHSTPHREIVLDYIIERKRLDDLVASIKDGRFHDQKFRLKKSGVKNVVYIIEDYSMGGVEGGVQETIETAVSSTQVVNGFFVKRTGKLDDTIRYLVRMTKMLERVYSKKPLPLIPSNLITARTYTALLLHLRITFPTLLFHPTYTDFSSLVSKSGTLTLRDVYLKMLMCIRGISVEKAVEIQKLYPTPSVLIEAYSECETHEDKYEMLFKAFEGKVGRKKVGRVLSGKVAEVWAGVVFEGDGR